METPGLNEALVAGSAAGAQVVKPAQMSTAALETLVREVDHRLELFDKIHQIIDSRVTSDCFDRFEEGGQLSIRRNANYAKVVHGIVRGSFIFLKDAAGNVQMKRYDFADEKGPYFVYEVFGAYHLGGEVTEAHGSFSSRDKFFGKRAGAFKEIWEVDERSIREAAITECFKKAVFKSLGYGDSNAAEMERAGKDAKGIQGHTFQAGKQGGSTDTQAQADDRGQIEKMCRALLAAGFQVQGEAVPASPEDVLRLISCSRGKDRKPDGRFPGWKSFKGISDKGLDRTKADVTRTWEKYAQAPDDDADQDGGGSNGPAAGKTESEEDKGRRGERDSLPLD